MPDTEQPRWNRSRDEAPAAPEKRGKIRRLLAGGALSVTVIALGTAGLGISAPPAFAYTAGQAQGQTIYQLDQVAIYNPPSGGWTPYQQEYEYCTYLGTNQPNVPQWNCYGNDEWLRSNGVIQCQEQFQFGPQGALLYSRIDYDCGA